MKEKTEDWLEEMVPILDSMDESDLSGALIRDQVNFPDYVKEDWDSVIQWVRVREPHLVDYFIDEREEWE